MHVPVFGYLCIVWANDFELVEFCGLVRMLTSVGVLQKSLWDMIKAHGRVCNLL